MDKVFSRTGFLLPKNPQWEKWSVVACDQFTSDPAGYWEPLDREIGEAPSTLRLILPEAFLPAAGGESPALCGRIEEVRAAMSRYLEDGIFKEYRDAYVYVERTLPGGGVRRGLIGKLDLEQYDYTPGSRSPIRPTEGTVESRLPVRAQIRRGAPLELPHILALVDDPGKTVIEPLARQKAENETLYDFPLCRGGGRVAGWLLKGEAAGRVDAALLRLFEGKALQVAVGDGNHSLAAAKLCWEQLRETLPPKERQTHPARYAMVELVNIRDDGLCFEPIHRVILHTRPEELLRALRQAFPDTDGVRIGWMSGGREESFFLPGGTLPAGLLQPFLDGWLRENPGEIDYIHGEREVRRLAREQDAAGLLLPAMDKGALFSHVEEHGVLPRKTFSMGEACDKRYYLECRRISRD